MRFEPGQERGITLVAFGGAREVHGLRGKANGPTDKPPGDDVVASVAHDLDLLEAEG
jgi:hypothetical protein